MGFVKEFREFAMRGNVVDMAVGIIIGAAFGAIVKSLVDKVLMPPIGLLMGGVDFADKRFVLQDAVAETTDAAGATIAAVPEVAIYYGDLINTIINFIIVALAIFVMIKVMNRAMELAKQKEEEAPAAPPEPSKEEQLLTEIRDLLAKKA